MKDISFRKIIISSIYGKRKCKSCGDLHDDLTYKNCAICRIASALRHKERRHEHINRKLCTECCEGSNYNIKIKHRYRKCKSHLKYHREYMRGWSKKKRNKIKKAA